MTDDDRLAPVTSLFGEKHLATDHLAADHPAARGGRRYPSRAGSPGAAGSSASPRGASDAWASEGQSAPGADEADGQTSATVDVDPDALVTTLPTYAAFAATTESTTGATSASSPDSARAGRFAARGGQVDDHAEAPDPVESLEAAQTRAENVSLHALSRRGVSSSEMTKTLRSRDLPEEVVQSEVERLERVGLLDDVELAANLVRTKQDRKGLGKGAITNELRQRGVAQEAIEQAVADIDDDDEQARADEWAVKRAGQLRGLDQATAERRLNAFLMRRGYRSEVVRRAVATALPRGGSSRGGGVRFE